MNNIEYFLVLLTGKVWEFDFNGEVYQFYSYKMYTDEDTIVKQMTSQGLTDVQVFDGDKILGEDKRKPFQFGLGYNRKAELCLHIESLTLEFLGMPSKGEAILRFIHPSGKFVRFLPAYEVLNTE